MTTLIKKIELVANLAIIIVAVLLGTVLVRNYLLPRSQPQQNSVASSLQPGSKISLQGVDWSRNGRTLLLALSTHCHFCTESAAFYKRIAQERATAVNIRLVAVSFGRFGRQGGSNCFASGGKNCGEQYNTCAVGCCP